ncbi:MAG: hypothetical protein HC782_00245 [Gammaproteobacteria bacterium]|nr:hypothetical protein [Gammaproteobacteria bacterium]
MTTRRQLLTIGTSLAVSQLGHLTGCANVMPAQADSLPTPTNAKQNMKPLNILILGGTGFTGPHQVRYAVSRGTRSPFLIVANVQKRAIGRKVWRNYWATATRTTMHR